MTEVNLQCHMCIQDEYSDIQTNHLTTDDSHCYFECLPGELLQKIFSFFSQCELCQTVAPVCHRWRDCAYDPIHWRKIELKLGSVLEPEVLKTLLIRTTLLKTLVITANRSTQFLSDDLNIFTFDMPHLQDLHLRFIESLDRDCLRNVLSRTPVVDCLNVEGCTKVDDGCIDEICRLERLKVINFSYCRLISDDGLIAFASKIQGLVLLNIDGITHVTERSVKHVIDTHFKTLQCLYLDGEEISDLSCISSCAELQNLSVSYATNLDDRFLAGIMKLSKLEKLRLRKGDGFTDNGLKNLFTNGSMKRLIKLDLSECGMLNDSVISAICTRYGPFLQKIVLSWCWDVTDVGISAIVNSCRSLRHLILIGLHRITGTCFQNIPETMPLLKRLDLTKCNEIDDEIISGVVCRKRDLTAMDYYGEIYEV